MKWAEALVFPAPLLQLDVPADQIGKADPIADLVEEVGWKGHGA